MNARARSLTALVVSATLLVGATSSHAAAPAARNLVSQASRFGTQLKTKSNRIFRRHGGSHVGNHESEEKMSLGAKVMEKVADLTGTPAWLALQAGSTIAWIAGKGVLGDPDLFKLNVTISVVTMLTTSLVAISQRRQMKRDRQRYIEDRQRAEEDFEVDKRSEAKLNELGDQLALQGAQLAKLTEILAAKNQLGGRRRKGK